MAGALLASTGCDRAPEAIIFPEFTFAYSFETGLDGWTQHYAGLGSATDPVTSSAERASQGSRSAAVTMVNPGGAGAVWITRALDVTPDQRYTVEVTFDLGTGDHGTVSPWTLVVGATVVAPTTTAQLQDQGDTASDRETATGVVWTEKTVTLAAQADDEGQLHLTLGIRGTSPGTRGYWLDNVRLVLTRS